MNPLSPAALVRNALEGSGLDLTGAAPIDAYDARAPEPLRSARLLPAARSVVIVASGGRALWPAFRAWLDEGGGRAALPHPLDAYVAGALDRADAALAAAGVAFRRFEPTFTAPIALDFRALGELAGLGVLGPFGMLIHPRFGPWWALRGAYLVGADVAAPAALPAPCAGCPAPCVADRAPSDDLARATIAARERCVVGAEHRYTDAQLAFHYGRAYG